MSRLQLKNRQPDESGLVHRVTPASAGWHHVGFELHRLRPGQAIECRTGANEACLVLIAGRADIAAGGELWHGLGERVSPFERTAPHAVYVPCHAGYQVMAVTDVELAICTAPGGGEHRARLIDQSTMAASTRGQGTNARHIRDILQDRFSRGRHRQGGVRGTAQILNA